MIQKNCFFFFIYFSCHNRPVCVCEWEIFVEIGMCVNIYGYIFNTHQRVTEERIMTYIELTTATKSSPAEQETLSGEHIHFTQPTSWWRHLAEVSDLSWPVFPFPPPPTKDKWGQVRLCLQHEVLQCRAQGSRLVNTGSLWWSHVCSLYPGLAFPTTPSWTHPRANVFVTPYSSTLTIMWLLANMHRPTHAHHTHPPHRGMENIFVGSITRFVCFSFWVEFLQTLKINSMSALP